MTSLAHRIIEAVREPALPAGFDGFGFDDVSPMKAVPLSAAQKAYKTIYGLKVGDTIKVGNVKFDVAQVLRQSPPAFKRQGTAGRKYYQVNFYEDGTVGMYATGGSGQRIEPDSVKGMLTVVK
jgi:hypothetical protein